MRPLTALRPLERRLSVALLLLAIVLIGIGSLSTPFSSSSSAAASASTDAALIRWVERNGGLVSGVAPGFIPGQGKGLLPSRPLRRGDEVVVVPAHLWMSEFSAGRSAVSVALQHPTVRRHAEGYLRLALHLEWERHQGPQSAWAPFIASLPAEPLSPLFFTAAHVAALGSPLVEEMVRVRQADLDRTYLQLFPLLFAHFGRMFPRPGVNRSASGAGHHVAHNTTYVAGGHTKASFAWSVAQVLSRSFRLVIEAGAPPAWTMIPFIDYMNHRHGSKNQYVTRENAFRMVAERDYQPAVERPAGAAAAAGAAAVAAGDGAGAAAVNAAVDAAAGFTADDAAGGQQLFISYGPWTSRQFLLNYGMVVRDNPHDFIMLVLTDISLDDALSCRQRMGRSGRSTKQRTKQRVAACGAAQRSVVERIHTLASKPAVPIATVEQDATAVRRGQLPSRTFFHALATAILAETPEALTEAQTQNHHDATKAAMQANEAPGGATADGKGATDAASRLLVSYERVATSLKAWIDRTGTTIEDDRVVLLSPATRSDPRASLAMAYRIETKTLVQSVLDATRRCADVVRRDGADTACVGYGRTGEGGVTGDRDDAEVREMLVDDVGGVLAVVSVLGEPAA